MELMSSDELFDYMIAGVKHETKIMQRAYQNVVDWPRMRDEAYKNYGDALGRLLLTDDEKKQALLDHVLRESE